MSGTFVDPTLAELFLVPADRTIFNTPLDQTTLLIRRDAVLFLVPADKQVALFEGVTT